MSEFETSPEQDKKIKMWFKSHICPPSVAAKHHGDPSVMTGFHSGGGIGECVRGQCTWCKAEIDVTEYDKW